MCETSNFDINFLISKFGNALYFTIITFTTVGYGDIMPLNWMKLVVSLESFLGVFFTVKFCSIIIKEIFVIEFVEVCTYSINSNYKGYDIPLKFTSLEYHSFRSIENQKTKNF